jgi:hypothetical protein
MAWQYRDEWGPILQSRCGDAYVKDELPAYKGLVFEDIV